MRIQRKKTAQGRGGSAGQGMAEGAKGTEGKSKTGQDRARQGKTMQRAGQRDTAEGQGSVAKETTMYWMAGSNTSSNSSAAESSESGSGVGKRNHGVVVWMVQ
jgi:hypothetical protein